MPSGVSNIGYEERRDLNEAAKQAIAQVCAQEIPDGASVFLNIGTSTEAVARALLAHRDLMVITNNMNVANILVANAECEIVVAGASCAARTGADRQPDDTGDRAVQVRLRRDWLLGVG